MASSNSDASKHYALNDRFARIGDKNVWAEFTGLAKETNAVNLGQGFPDYQSIPYLADVVTETLNESNPLMHQYTRSGGHIRLVNAIAATYSAFLGRTIDPMSEVLVTVGAYGSLFNVFSSFLNKNDEVIIVEPFYDCYAPMTEIADAKANCVFVSLRPTRQGTTDAPQTSADWKWDPRELEAAFTPRTKMIVINTPNNPLGKIYSREELEQVAELCKKHNVICLSDEVYEHITYDREHTRMASLPGMWERTVTVGSAGKAFSSTGVKLGWTYGPKELLRLCQVAHQNNVYCCPTFMQEVIARCFELELKRLNSPESYYNTIKSELKPKRDALASLLIGAGLAPVVPEGGYFMLADISALVTNGAFESDATESRDYKFVKYLCKEKKLATIPMSAFYSTEHKLIGENYIRFCFFKNDSTLENAANILKKMSSA